MKSGSSPTLEVAGATATITLRRPHHHNRIDPDDPAVLLRHIDAVRCDAAIRLLVVTGEGDRTFCSGYTLERIGTHLDRTLEDMLDALESLAIPTLCAMNGSAYGGGTDLALACDFRVGVHGCKLVMPAARFGLHYYPGGLRRFVLRLGPTAAKKIFLTSMPLGSEELLRIGFLSDVVEPGQLHASIDAYRENLFRCEPGAVCSMKRDIDAIARGDWTEDAGRAAYEVSLQSSETSRRLAALAGP